MTLLIIHLIILTIQPKSISSNNLQIYLHLIILTIQSKSISSNHLQIDLHLVILVIQQSNSINNSKNTFSERSTWSNLHPHQTSSRQRPERHYPQRAK